MARHVEVGKKKQTDGLNLCRFRNFNTQNRRFNLQSCQIKAKQRCYAMRLSEQACRTFACWSAALEGGFKGQTLRALQGGLKGFDL